MCLQVCWGARGSRSAASWCTSAGSCPAPVDSAPPPVDPSDTERLWRSTSSHLYTQIAGTFVTQIESNKIRRLMSDNVLNLNRSCSGSPWHVFMNDHFLMMTGRWSKNRECLHVGAFTAKYLISMLLLWLYTFPLEITTWRDRMFIWNRKTLLSLHAFLHNDWPLLRRDACGDKPSTFVQLRYDFGHLLMPMPELFFSWIYSFNYAHYCLR